MTTNPANTGLIDIDEFDKKKEYVDKTVPSAAPRKYEYKYLNILKFIYGYSAAIYGIYLCFTIAKWPTIILNYFLTIASILGITAGVHRLWSHNTYKAKLPLQIILMIFHCISNQHTAIYWVRDHRLHHKYCDSDADPHNASRGFFFSHIGWLMIKKHPKVIEKGKTIDMSDVYNNPVLVFQEKYAIPLIGSLCFLFPTMIPMYFWGESFTCSWNITALRYMLSLNITFSVNSAAHLWGFKPYDRTILPTQIVSLSFFALGEAFHNYHHVFPWDYRAAEFGNRYLNFTTLLIDFFAKIGWAYDLKTASDEIVRKRMLRTGDGTDLWGNSNKDDFSEKLM